MAEQNHEVFNPNQYENDDVSCRYAAYRIVNQKTIVDIIYRTHKRIFVGLVLRY